MLQQQQRLVMQQQQQQQAGAGAVSLVQSPTFFAQAPLSHQRLPQTIYPGNQNPAPQQQSHHQWQPQAAPAAFQELFSGMDKEDDDDFADFAAAPPAPSVPSKVAKSAPHGVDRNAPLDMGLFGATDEPQQQVWQ